MLHLIENTVMDRQACWGILGKHPTVLSLTSQARKEDTKAASRPEVNIFTVPSWFHMMKMDEAEGSQWREGAAGSWLRMKATFPREWILVYIHLHFRFLTENDNNNTFMSFKDTICNNFYVRHKTSSSNSGTIAVMFRVPKSQNF